MVHKRQTRAADISQVVFVAPLGSGSRESDGGAMQDVNEITFLSYNVGLLRFRLCGCCEVFSNPPFAMARLPHISPAIRKFDADIVAIQEVYEQSHVDRILSELADLYPHHARVNSGGCLSFHNGLMVLSKWPILNVELERLRTVSTLEKFLATKSQFTNAQKPFK